MRFASISHDLKQQTTNTEPPPYKYPNDLALFIQMTIEANNSINFFKYFCP